MGVKAIVGLKNPTKTVGQQYINVYTSSCARGGFVNLLTFGQRFTCFNFKFSRILAFKWLTLSWKKIVK